MIIKWDNWLSAQYKATIIYLPAIQLASIVSQYLIQINILLQVIWIQFEFQCILYYAYSKLHMDKSLHIWRNWGIEW